MARGPAGVTPASSRRATGFTRATSLATWWRFCESTTRPLTRAILPSTLPGLKPAQSTYRGYTVYKHGFGSQGPVLLQTLNILEQFDLHAMGYASADYLHTLVEAMKLAYADRDSFYADPAFVKVPSEGLLSKAYAKERAALIDPKRSSRAFAAGDPLKYDSQVKQWPYWKADVQAGATTARAASNPLVMASLGQDAAGVLKDTTI